MYMETEKTSYSVHKKVQGFKKLLIEEVYWIYTLNYELRCINSNVILTV